MAFELNPTLTSIRGGKVRPTPPARRGYGDFPTPRPIKIKTAGTGLFGRAGRGIGAAGSTVGKAVTSVSTVAQKGAQPGP